MVQFCNALKNSNLDLALIKTSTCYTNNNSQTILPNTPKPLSFITFFFLEKQTLPKNKTILTRKINKIPSKKEIKEIK